ncbi:hypothetical protein O1611_g5892 [Lasiodiplodia mahajangana]|uniref:Uncharacterized protein n=1 Tax=Lasiodiplodia mahajangana TaxID=1108764 RepID=A0ACC2JJR4_9PEZI|nr:hypothetical protein O1611_g5892 [Lasiodiplodia mahajangana]
MYGTIRGDGLIKAHNALAVLAEDPQRLERMRERFDKSPPLYRSYSSLPTTRSAGTPPSELEQRRAWRKMEIFSEHIASFPSNQFKDQIDEERQRIYQKMHPTHPPPQAGGLATPIKRLAVETVKSRWIEQGMWKDEWTDVTKQNFTSTVAGITIFDHDKPRGRWKHEEPLGSETELEAGSTAEAKGSEEIRKIAERLHVLEREREASRPYHQFLWQVSEERERIRDEQGFSGAPAEDLADVNTRAYEAVKSRWVKWTLWHHKWGVLPGMWWKHERSLEELRATDPILAQLNELEAQSHEPAGMSHRPLTGELGYPLAGLQDIDGDCPSLSPHSPHLAQNQLKSSQTVQQLLGSTGAIRDARLEAYTPPTPAN